MKHMKKSMLVTTVMMVVLLVVALSTATFAWYTSNTQVTSTATTIASAEAADANLEFVWKNGSAYVYNGTSITFSTGSSIHPMVPTAIPKNTDTSMGFIGATVNSAGTTFTSASAPQTAWTQQYASTATETVYTVTTAQPSNWATHYTTYYTREGTTPNFVYNKLQVQETAPTWVADTYYSMTATTADPFGVPSGSTITELFIANRATSGTSGDLKIEATIANVTGTTLAAALRIAVFFQAGETESATYKGTLASAAAGVNFATNGSWAANSVVSEQIGANGYTSTTSVTIGEIPANTESTLLLYVWFDGSMLGNANAGGTASFALTVSKA